MFLVLLLELGSVELFTLLLQEVLTELVYLLQLLSDEATVLCSTCIFLDRTLLMIQEAILALVSSNEKDFWSRCRGLL